MTRGGLWAPRHWLTVLRFVWFKLRHPNVVTHGMVFLAPGVEVVCRRGLGHLEIGRRVWIGRGTAIRCHEGSLRIGDKVVLGQGDTLDCYLHVEIGDETIVADDVFIADYDHRFDDLDSPIRKQGIAKAPVRVGRDCWIGTKATVLRGSSIGEGSVVGAHALVKGSFPPRSVVGGVPAKLIRKRGE